MAKNAKIMSEANNSQISTLNSQLSTFNSCDKREQNQACLDYAERSKNHERSE
jgi:hypothetical protein